jgi:ribonuclease VapC
MTEAVLDTSVLLAYIHQENGHLTAKRYIENGAAVSVANLAEVASVLVRNGKIIADVRKDLQALELSIYPVDQEQAYYAAALMSITRPHGLSLGDRLCLALAAHLKVPVVTADKAWAKVAEQIGVDLQLIR